MSMDLSRAKFSLNSEMVDVEKRFCGFTNDFTSGVSGATAVEKHLESEKLLNLLLEGNIFADSYFFCVSVSSFVLFPSTVSACASPRRDKLCGEWVAPPCKTNSCAFLKNSGVLSFSFVKRDP